MKCKAYFSFEGVRFDHGKDTPRSRQKLETNSQITRYDWSSLTNRDICNKYTVTVKNQSDTLQEISKRHTLNDEYENILNAHIEAATECIPIKPKAKWKVPRWLPEVRNKQDNFKKLLAQLKEPQNANAHKLRKDRKKQTNSCQTVREMKE